MHKQCNAFDQKDEKNLKTVLKSTFTTIPTTQAIKEIATNIDINCERTLSNQESIKKISNSKRSYEESKKETNAATTTSCTSSTDSGVNISDNDEILPSSSPTFQPNGKAITVNKFNKQLYKNTDVNNCFYNIVVDNEGCDDDANSTNFGEESKSRMKQHLHAVDTVISQTDNHNRYQANENFNDSKNEATASNSNLSLQNNGYINQQETSISIPSPPSSENSSKVNPPSNVRNCNSSPVVSIRSICSSTIITSESDSDSDINGDIEGVHENYVIKKLGSDVTFPSKHPEIPNINSGHTLLNQKVQTVGSVQQPSPLAALAAIGDNFGQAQALGGVPSVSQRPQIGSIALSNSSDVTFGDKHFYEGPVTIQQFLIDSRDKWKDNNGKYNPTSQNDNNENSNNVKDIKSSSARSVKIYEHILKRKKVLIPSILTVTALLIVATILGVLQNENKNSNSSNIYDDECSGNSTLCLITRDVWRAHPQKNTLDKQKLPLRRAIISHTASEACDSLIICSERIRVIQEFHMNSLGWDDIGYNFLISSDGRVYEGRGWDAIGAHTKGYNTGSVGITFIGTYMTIPPTELQLKACLALLDEGLRLNKLSENYHVYGARQFAATESPGNMLYRQIKKWQRWSSNINLN